MTSNVERSLATAAFALSIVAVLIVPTMRLRATVAEISQDFTAVTGTEVTDTNVSIAGQLLMTGAGMRFGVAGPPIFLGLCVLVGLVVATVLVWRNRWTGAFLVGIASIVVLAVYASSAPARMAEVANLFGPTGSNIALMEGAENVEGELGVQGSVHPVGFWIVLAVMLVPVAFCVWRHLVAKRESRANAA